MPKKAVKRGPTPQKGELLPIHKRAIQLLASGLKPKEVAKELELNESTLTRLKKHPQYQDYLARQVRQMEKHSGEAAQVCLTKARDILDRGTVRAARKLMKLMKSPDEAIALKAATKVLEMRLPEGEKDQSDHGKGISMSEKTFEMMITALQESGRRPKFVEGKLISEEIPHAVDGSAGSGVGGEGQDPHGLLRDGIDPIRDGAEGDARPDDRTPEELAGGDDGGDGAAAAADDDGPGGGGEAEAGAGRDDERP